QAEDGIRYFHVTGVQTCALPILCLGVVLGAHKELLHVIDPGLVTLVARELEVVIHLDRIERAILGTEPALHADRRVDVELRALRSEERRVGKESSARWSW